MYEDVLFVDVPTGLVDTSDYRAGPHPEPEPLRPLQVLYSPDAEWLSSVAISHPGWYGYEYGVSGDPRMVIDQGPNALIGDSMMRAEMLDAPGRWSAYDMPFEKHNLPPLIQDGSAQRAAYVDLGLVEFTPIGPGETWMKDFRFTQPDDIFDIETWQNGLGQIANNVALVYATGSLDKSGVQGSGITGQSVALPVDLTRAWSDPDAPNPDYLGDPA